MKTHTLAIFFATVALPLSNAVVSAEGYRQRAHDLASCEDMAEIIKQRNELIKTLQENIDFDENKLAARVVAWESKLHGRQQQKGAAICDSNGGDQRLRLLRGSRGRQNGDGNCDEEGLCEQQRLGPKIYGEGVGAGRNGAGGLFGTGKCDGEGCDQQRGDGQGPGRGDNSGRGAGLFSIFRDTSCGDEDVKNVDEIIKTINDLVKNNNQPATRLVGGLETFVEECESD